MRLLQRKQISVSAGSGKKTFFPINGIDKRMSGMFFDFFKRGKLVS